MGEVLKLQVITWLVDKEWQWSGAAFDEVFLNNILTHQQGFLNLIQVFVEGIKAIQTKDKTSAFENVLQIYPTLALSDQRLSKEYWNCAAAWLYHGNPENEQLQQWPEQWQKFKTQRNGNVPIWMEDLVKKLGVEFPN